MMREKLVEALPKHMEIVIDALEEYSALQKAFLSVEHDEDFQTPDCIRTIHEIIRRANDGTDR